MSISEKLPNLLIGKLFWMSCFDLGYPRRVFFFTEVVFIWGVGAVTK